MYKLLVVVVASGVIVFAKLPPYIHKCSIKDPNINSCALNSARQALPNIIKGDGQYNLPVLDPLMINNVTANNGKVDMVYEPVLVKGLKDLYLDSIRFDFDNKNIIVEGKLPILNFTGDYRMNGKLMGHYVFGTGPFYIPFFDTAVKYTTRYNLYGHDDCDSYLVLHDYALQLLPEKMTLDYGNLFNGNTVLGSEANKYFNENAISVLSEVAPQVFDSLGLAIHKILSNAATTVLYKDIFDDIEC